MSRSREFPAWDSALGLVTLGFLSATMGLQVGSIERYSSKADSAGYHGKGGTIDLHQDQN
jgi:hypothetical protein